MEKRPKNDEVEEKDLNDFKEEMRKDIIKSLDEVDDLLRKSSRRFLDLFVGATLDKISTIWENNKIIVQEKIREGRKDGNKKKVKTSKKSTGKRSNKDS